MHECPWYSISIPSLFLHYLSSFFLQICSPFFPQFCICIVKVKNISIYLYVYLMCVKNGSKRTCHNTFHLIPIKHSFQSTNFYLLKFLDYLTLELDYCERHIMVTIPLIFNPCNSSKPQKIFFFKPLIFKPYPLIFKTYNLFEICIIS